MFQSRSLNDCVVGFEAQVGRTLFFFGTRHTQREDLSTLYPDLRFCFLKQVHGNAVVQARPDVVATADGHRTNKFGMALVIQTADCLPILLSGTSEIMALHAGWRGLANLIIQQDPLGSADLIAIGPHIRRDKFEVGLDVAETLSKCSQAKDAISKHPDPEKRFVDLTAIATSQLNDVYPHANMITLPDCTYSSELFQSYRRGKASGERQYSFVARV